MLKRLLTALALTLMLVFAAFPIQPVQGVLMTPAEMEMVNVEPAGADGQAKKGNAFVRVITAPFKAIGRLFGAGKKDNKLHRLSEKDVKKFETAGTLRVVDATTANTSESQGQKTNAAPATNAKPATEKEANKISARQKVERARTLMNDGDINQAIEVLDVAISLDPKNGEAHNLMGIAYESKGMREWAFKSLQLAVRLDNDQPEFLNNLGFLHFKNGDYDKAARYLQRAVKISPEQQRYWNNLGLAQVQREKFDDAYKCFERAVGEFEGHMNLANRLQTLGYEKEAVKHLELARVLQPNSKEILVRLISLYKRAGKVEQSEEARSAFVSLSTVATTPNQ